MSAPRQMGSGPVLACRLDSRFPVGILYRMGSAMRSAIRGNDLPVGVTSGKVGVQGPLLNGLFLGSVRGMATSRFTSGLSTADDPNRTRGVFH